jgi:opacity protein-like surface antigen
MGAGIGSMSYEAKSMKDTKTVYTMQAGINYSFTKNIYAIAGINYLNTNGLGIKKNQYIYSNVESMLSGEIGVGLRF